MVYSLPRAFAPFALSRPPQSWGDWWKIHGPLVAAGCVLLVDSGVGCVGGWVWADAHCGASLASGLLYAGWGAAGAAALSFLAVLSLSLADARSWIQLPLLRVDIATWAWAILCALCAGSWAGLELALIADSGECEHDPMGLYYYALAAAIVAFIQCFVVCATVFFVAHSAYVETHPSKPKPPTLLPPTDDDDTNDGTKKTQ